MKITQENQHEQGWGGKKNKYYLSNGKKATETKTKREVLSHYVRWRTIFGENPMRRWHANKFEVDWELKIKIRQKKTKKQ